jgi:ATP-binding cassette subfamily F protein 3
MVLVWAIYPRRQQKHLLGKNIPLVWALSLSHLSGGQKTRALLARLLLEKPSLLILDEPTNHLDIPSQEALQAALEQFEGTILLISHDRYLVNRLATQIWELDNGRLRVNKGGYPQYLEQRDREAAALKEAELAARKTATQLQNDSLLPSKNALRKQAEEVEAVETLIGETETKLEQISKALQRATRAETFDKIQSLSVEYTATENQLAHLLEKWEKLAHE